MKNIIIFSQAPRDLRYIIELVNSLATKINLTIYVINLKTNYDYLNSINLNARIIYLKTSINRNIFDFIRNYFILLNIHYKYFKNINCYEVYYFSGVYDYVVPYIIERLKRKNTIYFIDIYKHIFNRKKICLKDRIKELFISLLLNVKFQYVYIGTNKIYRCLISDVSVKEIILNKSKYICNFDNISINTILLFETDVKTTPYYKNYEEDLKKIIEVLEKKFKIYIKPHPRLGYTKLLENYNVKILPQNIPGEFININNFLYILGMHSTILADIAINNSKVYSLLNLFSMEKQNYLTLKKYLDIHSNNRIKYLNCLDDL